MAKKSNKPVISEQVQDQGMAMAKANQKPGQTKDQTKLIAQGIAKGIAEYKKQQKVKQREADKQRKRSLKQSGDTDVALESEVEIVVRRSRLPWVLLIISWLLFAVFFWFFGR